MLAIYEPKVVNLLNLHDQEHIVERYHHTNHGLRQTESFIGILIYREAMPPIEKQCHQHERHLTSLMLAIYEPKVVHIEFARSGAYC